MRSDQARYALLPDGTTCDLSGKVEERVVRSTSDGLQVIGAGYGRTGTTTLQAALEQLGFGPCYKTMYTRLWHSRLWEAAAKGELRDWDHIFHGYRSAVDWPACTFYEQIAKAYPDAKVILTVRDPERWYESMKKTVYQGYRWISSPIFNITRIVPVWYHTGKVFEKVVWDDTFGSCFEDKKHAIGIFHRHTEEVKARIAPERLLVYEVKQGWEPLCTFLGVDVPTDTPFPHRNDASSFQRVTLGRSVGLLVAIGAALALISLVRRSRAVR